MNLSLYPPHMRHAVKNEASINARLARFVKELTPEEKHEIAASRMAKVDALPREVRALVHEYGFSTIVRLSKVVGLNARAIEFQIKRERAERDRLALMEDLMEVELVL